MSTHLEADESGRAYMVIGWVVVLFALLVMFFEPAAVKIGQTRFGIIAGAMVLVGLMLNIYGYRLRRRRY
jgi:hypothetical protein